ncbi:hypothetical protein Mal15_25950 [Stieleria maiorica]|uniref:Uncharacterized protein n=1 Tax=Stieleria maiorica TaxID=2795974 RepID=A0A5B9MCP1_9BACT|nr:hypothetical protein Mal15_25950 [Stieleria maiorica]
MMKYNLHWDWSIFLPPKSSYHSTPYIVSNQKKDGKLLLGSYCTRRYCPERCLLAWKSPSRWAWFTADGALETFSFS